jgi:hypothetical protein
MIRIEKCGTTVRKAKDTSIKRNEPLAKLPKLPYKHPWLKKLA